MYLAAFGLHPAFNYFEDMIRQPADECFSLLVVDRSRNNSFFLKPTTFFPP
jgi:hypothetical protein